MQHSSSGSRAEQISALYGISLFLSQSVSQSPDTAFSLSLFPSFSPASLQRTVSEWRNERQIQIEGRVREREEYGAREAMKSRGQLHAVMQQEKPWHSNDKPLSLFLLLSLSPSLPLSSCLPLLPMSAVLAL